MCIDYTIPNIEIRKAIEGISERFRINFNEDGGSHEECMRNKTLSRFNEDLNDFHYHGPISNYNKKFEDQFTPF